MKRILSGGAAMLACVLSPPAFAAYFHLSDPGLCNRTSKGIGDSALTLTCSSQCKPCKVSDSNGLIGAYGPERESWTIGAGVCATVSFELEAETLYACEADIDVIVGGSGGCSFRLKVTTTGSKSIDMTGCQQTADFELVPHHGGEHFQVDIVPRK